MATKATTETRRSAALHILAAHAKEAIKEDQLRDLLVPQQTPAHLVVSGTIGRGQVSFEVDGLMTVGHDTTAKDSSSPTTAQAVAALLEVVPKTKRDGLLQSGILPEASDETAALAAQLLELWKIDKGRKPKRGAVSFRKAEDL